MRFLSCLSIMLLVLAGAQPQQPVPAWRNPDIPIRQRVATSRPLFSGSFAW